MHAGGPARSAAVQLSHSPVPVAWGRTEALDGFRAFPSAWRGQADNFFVLHLAPVKGATVRQTALAVLAEELRATKWTTVVELAPMINLAAWRRSTPGSGPVWGRGRHGRLARRPRQRRGLRLPGLVTARPVLLDRLSVLLGSGRRGRATDGSLAARSSDRSPSLGAGPRTPAGLSSRRGDARGAAPQGGGLLRLTACRVRA